MKNMVAGVVLLCAFTLGRAQGKLEGKWADYRGVVSPGELGEAYFSFDSVLRLTRISPAYNDTFEAVGHDTTVAQMKILRHIYNPHSQYSYIIFEARPEVTGKKDTKTEYGAARYTFEDADLCRFGMESKGYPSLAKLEKDLVKLRFIEEIDLISLRKVDVWRSLRTANLLTTEDARIIITEFRNAFVNLFEQAQNKNANDSHDKTGPQLIQDAERRLRFSLESLGYNPLGLNEILDTIITTFSQDPEIQPVLEQLEQMWSQGRYGD